MEINPCITSRFHEDGKFLLVFPLEAVDRVNTEIVVIKFPPLRNDDHKSDGEKFASKCKTEAAAALRLLLSAASIVVVKTE